MSGSGPAASRHVLSVDAHAAGLRAVLLLPGSVDSAPLVIGVHGGPRPPMDESIARSDADPWLRSGFAYLAADYRASGVLGEVESARVLSGDDVPGPGDDQADVRACVDALVASTWAGRVDLDTIVVYGFSYGAYIVNRWATWADRQPRVRAVVCHEGVADLRTLDEASLRNQGERRGSSPASDPEHWSAASPLDRAVQVRHPMTLVYGEDGPCLAQGAAWRRALEAAGVEVRWCTMPGEGHVFSAEAMREVAAGVARDLGLSPSGAGNPGAER